MKSELFKNMADNTKVGLYFTDKNGKCEYVNKKWMEMAGLTFDEALGDGWKNGLHPDDIDIIFKNWNKTVASKGRWGLEYRFLNKLTQKVTWVYGVAEELIDENNSCIGYFGTNIDISDKKMVEHNMNLFSSTLYHDLTAYTRRIGSFADIIEEDISEGDSENCSKYIQKIKNNNDNLSNTIKALFSLAKLTEEKRIHEKFNMYDIIMEIINTYEDSIKDRKIEFEIDNDLEVNADKSLITILLRNLFDNSIKYTRTKDKSVIKFGKKMYKGLNVFYIEDNGVGFDIENDRGIFKPFVRFHSSKDYEGLGIGLAIVYRIIQAHGGEIWAEGKVGKGACFLFTLSY